MIARRLPGIALSAVLGVMAGGTSVARAPSDTGAEVCYRAAQVASEETGVPVPVLLAIALTETGRTIDGTFQPWPWTLNKAGDSFWLSSPEEALLILEEAVQSGTTNIDVGCFQINYRWHASAFHSLDAMIDPETNAIYAGKLLAAHFKDSGDWVTAAGAYHSLTDEFAEIYIRRFEAIYENLEETPDAPALALVASAENNFPFLTRGQQGSGGSIVPMAGSLGPLFGKP